VNIITIVNALLYAYISSLRNLISTQHLSPVAQHSMTGCDVCKDIRDEYDPDGVLPADIEDGIFYSITIETASLVRSAQQGSCQICNLIYKALIQTTDESLDNFGSHLAVEVKITRNVLAEPHRLSIRFRRSPNGTEVDLELYGA
jgi:hypothetical protein